MTEDPTKQELYERAQELDVPSRSSMDRDQLQQAVDEASAAVGPQSTEPPPRPPTGNWFRYHLLSIILASLFLITLIGHYYFQYQYEVDQAIQHGQAPPPRST